MTDEMKLSWLRDDLSIRINNPIAAFRYEMFIDEPVQETWAQKRRWKLLQKLVKNKQKALKWRIRAVKWPLVFIAFIVGIAFATFIGWLLHTAMISMMLGAATASCMQYAGDGNRRLVSVFMGD